MFSRMAAKSPPVGYTVQMGGGGGKERFLVYSCCTMNNSQAIKTPLTASSLARPSGSQKIDACRVLHIRCKQENTGDDVVGSRGSSILDHSTAKRPVSLIPCKWGGGGGNKAPGIQLYTNISPTTNALLSTSATRGLREVCRSMGLYVNNALHERSCRPLCFGSYGGGETASGIPCSSWGGATEVVHCTAVHEKTA